MERVLLVPPRSRMMSNGSSVQPLQKIMNSLRPATILSALDSTDERLTHSEFLAVPGNLER